MSHDHSRVLNSNADEELLKATFGPAHHLERTYQDWRAKIEISNPFEGSTFEFLPLLSARLREAGIEDDFSGRLKGVCRKVWVESQHALTNVFEAIDQLDRDQIPVALTRRTALVAIDPDRIRYTSSDLIDLTIPESHICAALESVRELGWEPPHWISRIDAFETDMIILVNAKWRRLRLSWRPLDGQTVAAAPTSVWDRIVRVQRQSRSFGVMASCDAAIEALTDPSDVSVFERGAILRRFIRDAESDAGAWDDFRERLSLVCMTKRGADNLRDLAYVFDCDEIRQTLSFLDKSEQSLPERVETWANGLDDRPINKRFGRAANYIVRTMRQKRKLSAFHAFAAAASYAAFRLTPARWRASTVTISARAGSNPHEEGAALKTRSLAS